MLRRTKIIATLGPATDVESTIESLIRAGIDLVRINFSHSTLADHQRRVRTVRECAADLGRAVGILGDLQGPKIRIARFQNGCIRLEPGRKFVLDAGPTEFEGSPEAVGVDYKQLPGDVIPGDFLLLDDGRIELHVDRVDDLKIVCTVKSCFSMLPVTNGMKSSAKPLVYWSAAACSIPVIWPSLPKGIRTGFMA